MGILSKRQKFTLSAAIIIGAATLMMMMTTTTMVYAQEANRTPQSCPEGSEMQKGECVDYVIYVCPEGFTPGPSPNECTNDANPTDIRGAFVTCAEGLTYQDGMCTSQPGQDNDRATDQGACPETGDGAVDIYKGYCIYNLFPTCENPNHVLVTDPTDPGTRYCIHPVTGERGQVGLECPPGTEVGGEFGSCRAKPGNNPR